MDEEAILGGLRSGEALPDYDYEDFEAGSTAFSVRPPMMSRRKEFAPIGAALNQVTGADSSTSSAWR